MDVIDILGNDEIQRSNITTTQRNNTRTMYVHDNYIKQRHTLLYILDSTC